MGLSGASPLLASAGFKRDAPGKYCALYGKLLHQVLKRCWGLEGGKGAKKFPRLKYLSILCV